MFKVTSGNMKLGSICAINLPYKKTCNPKAPCFKDCYCNKGNMRFPCVVNCYENNYQSFINNPLQAEMDINKQLPAIGYCRVHASGDFMNRSYFDMLIRIARNNKQVKFMAFTKQYNIVNEYLSEGKKIPSNFIIIFSAWYSDSWKVINPFNLPVSYVYNKVVNNTYDEKAFHCTGKCDKCFKCWNLEKGESVVFKKH